MIPALAAAGRNIRSAVAGTNEIRCNWGIVIDKVSGKLTVFFEGPFWVGVFERISDGKLSVCKVMFGAEPQRIFMAQGVAEVMECSNMVSKNI